MTNRKRKATRGSSHVKKKTNTFDDKFLFFSHIHVPVIVCDYQNGKLLYVNERFMNLTGLPGEECMGMPVKDFYKWVHESDLCLYENIVVKSLWDACSKHICKNTDKLCYSFNYRLKTKNGEYVHVLMQCSVLEWDENFFPKTTANLLTDLDVYKKDQKSVLTIKVWHENESLWTTIHTEVFYRVPGMLANREKNILMLMLEDKTANEIAEQMSMNPHTVRTHWRNILQKTGCSTQKKLKERAQVEGWI